jgi:hypothetical protein
MCARSRAHVRAHPWARCRQAMRSRALQYQCGLCCLGQPHDGPTPLCTGQRIRIERNRFSVAERMKTDSLFATTFCQLGFRRYLRPAPHQSYLPPAPPLPSRAASSPPLAPPTPNMRPLPPAPTAVTHRSRAVRRWHPLHVQGRRPLWPPISRLPRRARHARCRPLTRQSPAYHRRLLSMRAPKTDMWCRDKTSTTMSIFVESNIPGLAMFIHQTIRDGIADRRIY